MAQTTKPNQTNSPNTGIEIGPKTMVVMGKIGKQYQSPNVNQNIVKSGLK
jgi:hypothetical protein